jgi:hypothetical protein
METRNRKPEMSDDGIGLVFRFRFPVSRFFIPRSYLRVKPPSTTMVCPQMKPASAERDLANACMRHCTHRFPRDYPIDITIETPVRERAII